MRFRTGVRTALPAAVALVSLLCVGSASAASSPFGCRASFARVGLLGKTLVEPLVANTPTSPCATAGSGLSSVAVPSTGVPLVKAGPAGVFTFSSSSQPTTTGPVAPGAAALASLDGVTIPTGTGSIVIGGPVEATASYACVNGKVVSNGGSTLNLLYINGRRITLTPGQDITLPLGSGAYVSINHRIQTANSLTERVLDVHVPGLAEVVVGEAQVTRTAADPCAGTGSGSGGGGGSGGGPGGAGSGGGSTPPAVNACPAGSTFNPVDQFCEIVLPGGGTIIISRPFQGPTGGTVVALSVARNRFHSRCLFGAGPQYAIVGTNGPDRINGTSRGERILGLGGNDRIAGQGGDDCIDGGAGNDGIWAGNGNERVFGGTGNDRIWAGNGNDIVDGGPGNDRIYLGDGNDRVSGGAGNDVISVGRGNDRVDGGAGNDRISTNNGNDVVFGGPGNDVIFVGNGTDRVFGGPGNDRIYAPSERDFVNCGSGRDIAFVNVFASRYAHRHGCEKTRPIRPRQL